MSQYRDIEDVDMSTCPNVPNGLVCRRQALDSQTPPYPSDPHHHHHHHHRRHEGVMRIQQQTNKNERTVGDHHITDIHVVGSNGRARYGKRKGEAGSGETLSRRKNHTIFAVASSGQLQDSTDGRQ